MDSVQGARRIRMLGGVRAAGVLCAVGGAGWVANALLASAISQPHSVAFTITEVLWIIVQLLLLIGVVGLALSDAASGWFGGIALGLALLGRVDFVLAEIHSLILGEDSFLAAARSTNHCGGHDAGGHHRAPCEALERLAEIHPAPRRDLPLRGDVPLHIHHG
jgi:hypothetical protein